MTNDEIRITPAIPKSQENLPFTFGSRSLRLVRISSSIIRISGLLVAMFGTISSARAQLETLDSREYHLGIAGKAEWEWFEGQAPFSNRLDIHFTSEANEREATLFIRQTDVKLEWAVRLNDHKL